MSYKVDESGKGAERLNGPSGGRSVTGALFPFVVRVARYWWAELLVGVLWLVVAVVVLKFNDASIVTVGIITGIMFLALAGEEFALAVVAPSAKWLWALFAVLLTAAGIIALINPTDTFTAFADVLGFVFLLIGIVWVFHAFAERAFNDLWWLGLISGILMVGLAFWVSGEFFLTRADTLLVFAGVWAIMKGITDIIRGFQIRKFADS